MEARISTSTPTALSGGDVVHVVQGTGNLVFVGESPGSNPPDRPLSAAQPVWTGRRLARILELDWKDYERGTTRMNVSDVPGYVPKAQDGKADEVVAMLSYLLVFRALGIVFLGGRVAECLNLQHYPEFKTFPFGFSTPVRMLRIPHPSGHSRIYNDPYARLAARDAVTRLATETGALQKIG